ncbi:MAG: coproporphyrinogen-III oxidase family protein, partial [Candidatus Nanopelagicales bacterium]
ADLIYATPGETDADLRASVEGVLAEGIDHLSAYSLIVEPGTRLAARIRRGEMPAPDDDVAAERYALIDDLAEGAGLPWYEVSNWAAPGGECRHNLGYWCGDDWWGAGPGAHGHIGAVRWWNVKHPATYGARVAADELPVDGWERVGDAEARLEEVMLRIRLREGLPTAGLSEAAVAGLVRAGWVEEAPVGSGTLVLTRAGRLMADEIVRRLTDEGTAPTGPPAAEGVGLALSAGEC